MDFSDSSGELPLSRLCSPNRTSASCPSLPRYQAACVSILCGSARAVARITCAADSGGGTRERISLRPPDPHSPWHDAITQQSGRFHGRSGSYRITSCLPTILPEAAGSIQGIAVLASKATALFLKGQLPHGHRLPGGSPVFPLVVRDLFDMCSVVPHYEQFAVGLRRIRVNPFILETHSGTGECDRLSIR